MKADSKEIIHNGVKYFIVQETEHYILVTKDVKKKSGIFSINKKHIENDK